MLEDFPLTPILIVFLGELVLTGNSYAFELLLSSLKSRRV